MISQWYQTFIQANPIHNLGILGVIIVGLVPSFVVFVPDESVLIPVYALNPTISFGILMLIAYWLSIFASSMMMYLTAHHLTNLARKEKKKATEAHHLLYKYRLPVFLIAPSLIFGIGDIIIIYAGIKHIHMMKMIPFLLIGTFIRAFWGILIAMAIPTIFLHV